MAGAQVVVEPEYLARVCLVYLLVAQGQLSAEHIAHLVSVVALRAEHGDDALVTIRFSDEAKAFIDDGTIDVAKAMIQAGIEAASAIADERGVAKAEIIDSAEHTLH